VVVVGGRGTARRAVVAGGGDPPDSVAPYVTRYGNDPAFGTNPVNALPARADFGLATLDGAAVQFSLAELPGQSVFVAGHAVAFDLVRQLWYCDIEVDPGPSYSAFIRMALARFQPVSVLDAHLSRVVMADFAQVAPDRSVSVSIFPSPPRCALVSVTGLSYQATATPGVTIPGPSVMTVSLERRAAGLGGELGWEPLPNSQPLRLGGLIQPDGSAAWTSVVDLPDAALGPVRIVIEETEQFGLGNPLLATPGQRLVFTDVIDF
jgi:hypothetical protein